MSTRSCLKSLAKSLITPRTTWGNALRGLGGMTGSAIMAGNRAGNLYAYHPEQVDDGSVRIQCLKGRRGGFTPTGESVHIVAELSYGDDHFLCGRMRAEHEPLFMLSQGIPSELLICKSCLKHAKEGIV